MILLVTHKETTTTRSEECPILSFDATVIKRRKENEQIELLEGRRWSRCHFTHFLIIKPKLFLIDNNTKILVNVVRKQFGIVQNGTILIRFRIHNQSIIQYVVVYPWTKTYWLGLRLDKNLFFT